MGKPARRCWRSSECVTVHAVLCACTIISIYSGPVYWCPMNARVCIASAACLVRTRTYQCVRTATCCCLRPGRSIMRAVHAPVRVRAIIHVPRWAQSSAGAAVRSTVSAAACVVVTLDRSRRRPRCPHVRACVHASYFVARTADCGQRRGWGRKNASTPDYFNISLSLCLCLCLASYLSSLFSHGTLENTPRDYSLPETCSSLESAATAFDCPSISDHSLLAGLPEERGRKRGCMGTRYGCNRH